MIVVIINILMMKSMEKPISRAKYCSSIVLSACLTRHVQADNDNYDDDNDDYDDIDDCDDDGNDFDDDDDFDDDSEFVLSHSSVHVLIQCLRDPDGPV